MRYFLDTEFAERPCSIDLISIAIVAEDGREFYAESSDFQDHMANDWVKANVLTQLWSRNAPSQYNAWHRDGGQGGFMSRQLIAADVRRFIGEDKPEFWGYYCDYDWVVFCWLFGSMIDLPKGWPMYCRDIKQLCDSAGNPRLPPQGQSVHHALIDATWIQSTLAWLESFADDRADAKGRQLVGDMPWVTAHLTDEQIEDLKKQVGTCLRHFPRSHQ